MNGQTSVSEVTLFRDSAFCAAWSPYDSSLVTYCLPRNGYYEIFLANVSSTNQPINERCISCENISLPGKTVGNPIFHPNGKYILCIAEKADHPGDAFSSTPGIGQYSDVWVMTTDGEKAYQLTNTPNSEDSVSGVIFVFFSPDGKKIMWTQMTKAGNGLDCVLPFGKLCFGGWVIKIADFVDDTINGPKLQNIKTIQPGGVDAFNEGYGWTPDGSKILFASDYDQVWVWADQIYSMDTLGNNIQQLTTTGDSIGWPYCEHAFSSPDGEEIVWMTNRDNMVGSSKGGNDWFIMNADGTQQRRLTYFNDTTSSYWTGDVHVNGFGSFSPNGKKFIGDVGGKVPIQQDPNEIYKVYIVSLNREGVTLVKSVENKIADPILIFPIPTNESLNIIAEGNLAKMYYVIYDLMGNKLYEGNWIGKTFQLDTRNYDDGMYFLKIGDGKSTFIQKFLVKNP